MIIPAPSSRSRSESLFAGALLDRLHIDVVAERGSALFDAVPAVELDTQPAPPGRSPISVPAFARRRGGERADSGCAGQGEALFDRAWNQWARVSSSRHERPCRAMCCRPQTGRDFEAAAAQPLAE